MSNFKHWKLERDAGDGAIARPGKAEPAAAGVIFGTGFAPYAGGPMNYPASRG